MKPKQHLKKYNKLENNEVDTQNCCSAIIKSKFSQKLNFPEEACRKFSNDKHERGIKLVKKYHSKSNH